jgi:hypothetical protein
MVSEGVSIDFTSVPQECWHMLADTTDFALSFWKPCRKGTATRRRADDAWRRDQVDTTRAINVAQQRVNCMTPIQF